MKPGLLILGDSARMLERWRRAAQEALPQVDVLEGDALSPAQREQTRYALVWGQCGALLATLPHLKLMISVGAGVDHLLDDPDTPPQLPLVRMVDPGLTRSMGDFVLLSALMAVRNMPQILANQRLKRWEPVADLTPAHCPVGIMGLGELGEHAAKRLISQGFPLRAWVRTPRSCAAEGMEIYAGLESLDAFLRETKILIVLLPLTPATQRLIDRDLLAKLPRGATLINVARGGLMVEAAVLAALDSGQLSSAFLDVFTQEPLPTHSPFWDHPRVIVTPHIASVTQPESGILAVKRAIDEFESGQPLSHQVARARGY